LLIEPFFISIFAKSEFEQMLQNYDDFLKWTNNTQKKIIPCSKHILKATQDGITASGDFYTKS